MLKSISPYAAGRVRQSFAAKHTKSATGRNELVCQLLCQLDDRATHDNNCKQFPIQRLDPEECRSDHNRNGRERLEHLDKGHAQSARQLTLSGTHVKYAVLLRMREPENSTAMGIMRLTYTSC